MTTSFDFDPRSARIRLAEQRLRDAYARTPNAEIPIVDPGRRVPGTVYPERECLADFEKMRHNCVNWANGLAAADQDWPPMLNTFCGVCMAAEAFGCPLIFDDFGTAWTKPAITDLAQIDRLKPLPLREPYLASRLFAWIDYAQRELGTDVPLWTMDLQSPFSVAAHIIEATELLMACVTDPERVHRLCRMITDYSIEFMHAHLAQMENAGFPGRNFPSIPDRIGICIADDTPLIMLSPEMYREFALPYNAEIAQAFGGAHIHSCGGYQHNLDNLLATPGVRSVQMHVGVGEFPLPASAAEDHPFNRARGRVTMLVDTNDIARGDVYKGRGRTHFEEYVLPRLQLAALPGLILQSPGAGDGLADAAAAVAWTRRAAATVQPRVRY